jgi:hypothetical protein
MKNEYGQLRRVSGTPGPSLYQVRADPEPVRCMILVQPDQLPYCWVLVTQQQQPEGGHTVILRLRHTEICHTGEPAQTNIGLAYNLPVHCSYRVQNLSSIILYLHASISRRFRDSGCLRKKTNNKKICYF